MYYIGKVLTQLTSPLGLFITATLFAAPLIALRRKRLVMSVWMLAFLWMFACSLPAVSTQLRRGLEDRVPQRALEEYPAADAIVVLGGGVEGSRSGWRTGPHLRAGADRVWYGAQLFHAGRAPLVILSGGDSDWSESDEPEANAAAKFLRDLGVPESAIALENRSRNTAENAAYTKQLLSEHQAEKILLVTSALHMPRALALFRAQHIETTPAPTDFFSPPRNPLRLWLPDTEALDGSAKAIKEYLGILAERVANKTD